MLTGIIALVAVALLGFLLKLSKKAKEKQRLEDEFSAVKKEYSWRMEKLKEVVRLARTLATNGNQDAKIVLQGVNECYLNGNLEHDPVTFVGYQTFVSQYDKFVKLYKDNFNNLGNISKSISKATDVLKALPKINWEGLVLKYDKIIFFEKPKYDLQKIIVNLQLAHSKECSNLETELKQPNPDPIKLNSYINLVVSTLQAIQNQMQSVQANIEFNDAQVATAKKAPSKMKEIQADVLSASKLQGVTLDNLKKANELLSNIGTTQNVDLSTDLISALQVFRNIQNASLPIIKACQNDYRVWKQVNGKQAPARPGTNSRVAASQRHSDNRNETRAQVMLREEQIRKQRYRGNTVSSRTVINSNTNNYVDDYIQDDYQPNIVGNIVVDVIVDEIIDDIIQPQQPQGFGDFGGGQTGGAGAGGDWNNQPDPEPVYQEPEPYQEPEYNSSSNDDDN